jgi:hypothetical protein
MLFTPEQQNALLSEKKADQAAFERAAKPLSESLRRAQSLDPVNRVSYLESRCYMLNTLLREKIVHRRKRGFTLPFEHWLRDALRPVVEESLRKIGDGVLGTRISERAVGGVWEDFLDGRTSWSRPWSLYVLQRWCEQHLSN